MSVPTNLALSHSDVNVPERQESPAGAASDGFSLLKPQPKPPIFTKFDNVKSPRIAWTAERRRLLSGMWERGEKAPAIAAALGCKIGAVNVARARFGLKPRRVVPGRPKQESDEPAHKIERVAFATSRLMEFCTEKELVAQTGHESYEWSRVVIKELVDNGLDHCEEAGIAPVIKVTITVGKHRRPTRIVVQDNGLGIPNATVAGIIDYTVRVSSREAYISPTRGRQGNALKTILPMAYVIGGKIKGETWIEARGRKHRLVFSVNQIKQEPIVRDLRSRSRVRKGTRVTIFWPGTNDSEIDTDEIANLLGQFVWCNPHLTLRYLVNGKVVIDCSASDPAWTKYRACDATSAHWYNLEQFERYAGALIDHGQTKNGRKSGRAKVTVREFVAQFRGMSATEKQKQIVRELGASHMSLLRLFGSEKAVKHQRMEKLLRLLQQQTRPVRPELLGIIGKEHLRQLCISAGGEPQSFKYVLSADYRDDRQPYITEIAICPYKAWVAGKNEGRARYLITGVNFSATLENPFQTFRGMEGLDEILTELRAESTAPVIVCVHYVCPRIEYLDRGKSRIGLE
jgi:Histidine kinase-, DNA gyrase B-, and HSP90-like ATPase